MNETLDLTLEETDFLAGLWAEEMPDAASPACCESTASTVASSCVPSCAATLSSACAGPGC